MQTTNKMIELRKANKEDQIKEATFIRNVPLVENGFCNFFWRYLEESDEKLIDFVLNFCYSQESIPILTYFLWQDNNIVGMFHLLSKLTEEQKYLDGHISYCIDSKYRHQGLATKGLSLLIEEAKKIVPEDEIYMHTTKDNPGSLKVMLNCGAYIKEQDDINIFTRIKKKENTWKTL